MASISMDELRKMKVADLKKELKDRGLGITGTKDVLLERLQEALNLTEAVAGADSSGAADDAVVKSIDQLVEEDSTTAAEPEVTPTPAVVPSKENIPAAQADSDTSPATEKVVSLKGLSEEERLKARAEKFGGAVSDSAKKLQRAQRFGMPAPTSGSSGKIAATPATADDLDKMKKRAERFGMVVSNKLSKVDEDERKRKRMERFGNTVSTSTEGAKKVKLNSTNSDTDEKKKKRAERFGLT